MIEYTDLIESYCPGCKKMKDSRYFHYVDQYISLCDECYHSPIRERFEMSWENYQLIGEENGHNSKVQRTKL